MMTSTDNDEIQAQIQAEIQTLEDRLAQVSRELLAIDLRRTAYIAERNDLIGTLTKAPYKRPLRRLGVLSHLTYQNVSLVARAQHGEPPPKKNKRRALDTEGGNE